jgi:hypothetical protein
MQYASMPSDLWAWPDFTDLTPEERYYLLYLHINPHVSITGCYALPRRIAAAESGYNDETSDRILARLVEVGGWIEVDSDSREVLLLRWPEINPGWFAKNSNTYKSLCKLIIKIKSDRLRAVVQSWLISDAPLKGLASPLQAPGKHNTSPSPHITAPHITSPSSGSTDDDGAKYLDLAPLLLYVAKPEQNKIIRKIEKCLHAGHTLHDCHEAIDCARHGATQGPPWYGNWYGLAHHKLEELAITTPQPKNTTKKVFQSSPPSDFGRIKTDFSAPQAPWDMSPDDEERLPDLVPVGARM